MIQQRTAEANKATLEAEKERDELHNQIEQIEEQLQPKRARTHADAGDEEEAHRRPGHFWICKFGTFPGTMSCVEKKFELQNRKCKWEEYRGTRYSDGDVVELWLHRVADDLSGLTFQEWDPSAGSDDTSAPVAMLVNSSELRAADFHLAEVRPSSTRRGDSRRPSYAWRGSEKASGCG